MSFKARVHTRYQVPKTPIGLRRSGTFEWRQGVILNLSQGGLMIHCEHDYEKGDILDLEMNTTDVDGNNHQRKLKSEVMWKKPNLYGLRFLTKSGVTPANPAKPMQKRDIARKAAAKATAKPPQKPPRKPPSK